MSFSFLISSERSGSNLITKMVDMHSKVSGPSPKHLLRILAKESYRLAPLDNQANWNSLLDAILKILNSEFAVWKTKFEREDLEKFSPAGDLPKLLQEIFMTEARANGKEQLFIKELYTASFLPFLEWCFPGARFIWLVRDPRDMALSWRKNKAHAGGLIAGASKWRNDQLDALQVYFFLKSQGRAGLILYENLITEPEKELTKITDLLGLEFEKGMLEFHKNSLTRENADRHDAWRNLQSEVISSNSNKFLSELNNREVALIEKLCGTLMKAFGYEVITSKNDLQKLTQKDIKDLQSEEATLYKASATVPQTHEIVLKDLYNQPPQKITDF